ncbi:MAG: type 1 glutamine amidotransferase [Planctomycetota bacterium]|nr:type 1 glutamine amidotransferase [Planctomycetota bacterium]
MKPPKPRLKKKRIALLAAEGVHEHEFWTPYYRFKEEGAEVLVAGPDGKGVVYRGEGRLGKGGLDLAPTDCAIEDLKPGKLDALVIPGGIFGPLTLRAHEPALDLVRSMDRRRKVIGAICHAQWVLISAGILKGRRATSPGDIRIDMENAGAKWVKEEAVRDGHLVTAIYFGYLPAFLRLLIAAIEE